MCVWAQLLAELQDKLNKVEEAYADEVKALADAKEAQRHNLAEELELRWQIKSEGVVAAGWEKKVRSRVELCLRKRGKRC